MIRIIVVAVVDLWLFSFVPVVIFHVCIFFFSFWIQISSRERGRGVTQ